MENKKAVEEQINELTTLGLITRAYAKLSSIKIREIRDSVLSMRDFLGDLNEVFSEVLASYQREVQKLAKNKKKGPGGEITFLSHNGRRVAVFIAANTRLYGDLIVRTFKIFCDTIDTGEYEAVIVGKAGVSMFEQKYKDRPYTYFDFPDTSVDMNQLNALISHLVEYEDIKLFYPKFQNMIYQKATEFSVSSGMRIEGSESGPRTSYLFEPSLEEILKFFESEIFASLFEQTMKESQLAKFASRVYSMDRASENVKDRLKDLKILKMKASHDLNNKKQMTVLSGMFLWSGGRI